MNEKHVYILTLYTYDYHEWENFIAVSETEEGVKRHWQKLVQDKKGYYDAPLVPKEVHTEYSDKEVCHHVIERFECVK